MEANLTVQASTMPPTNLEVRRQTVPGTPNTPAASPAEPSVRARPERPPTQVAPAPSLEDLANGANINILSAHPSVNQRTTESLITSEFPLPFSDLEISESTIARYIDAVNTALASSFFRLNFNIHEETNLPMIQVIDTETDEILREIPPESRLDIMARIQEFSGLLFDGRS